MNLILFDTCVWISIYRGNERDKKFLSFLSSKSCIILIPSIVLHEISRVLEQTNNKIVSWMTHLKIESIGSVSINTATTLEATRLCTTYMKKKAIELGQKIVDIERIANEEFVNKSITDIQIKQLILKSAEIYGQLRYTHLNTHLKMLDILTSEQIALYNNLRGYSYSSQ